MNCDRGVGRAAVSVKFDVVHSQLVITPRCVQKYLTCKLGKASSLGAVQPRNYQYH